MVGLMDGCDVRAGLLFLDRGTRSVHTSPVQYNTLSPETYCSLFCVFRASIICWSACDDACMHDAVEDGWLAGWLAGWCLVAEIVGQVVGTNLCASRRWMWNCAVLVGPHGPGPGASKNAYP
jgi:hypothetical protein